MNTEKKLVHSKHQSLWISILMLIGGIVFISIILIILYFTTQDKTSYGWTPIK